MRQHQRLLPDSIVPLLEAVIASPAVATGLPLEFWRHDDHRAWIDAFMEFGAVLAASGIRKDELPHGYGLIAHLFDWEAQCQFSGWHAFAHRDSTIDQVIASYEAVGLADEAAGLRLARLAWRQSDGDCDASSAAYAKTPRRHPADLDRLEYLAAYFIDNADDLLYLR